MTKNKEQDISGEVVGVFQKRIPSNSDYGHRKESIFKPVNSGASWGFNDSFGNNSDGEQNHNKGGTFKNRDHQL